MASIAIMGAGGIGAYYGARLAEGGHDVAFIARGEHLAAIRKHGLRVRSPLGDAHIEPVRASDDPAEIGPADLVVHATKMTALAVAPDFIAPLVGPDTAVVTLQNGVEAPAILARALGPAHVLGGLAIISAHILEPGVVEQVGDFARIEFGAPAPAAREHELPVLEMLKVKGIEPVLADDINEALWRKFCILASGAGMLAATRLPYGAIRADEETRAMLRAAIVEAWTVARAEGIDLGDDYTDGALAMIDGFPYEMTASLAVDLERGKPLELPWFSGTVVRLAGKHGIDVPVHRFLWTILKLHNDGRAA